MSSLTSTQGRLRLVRPGTDRGRAASRRGRETGRNRSKSAHNGPQDAANCAQLTPSDPRWVLAVRTAELMGARGVLPPEKRDRLTRMGRMLGLTAFDVSLVIAIVQDQVRRGHSTLNAPGAGAAQLGMIQLKKGGRGSGWSRWWPAAAVAGMVLAAEGVVVWVWIWG